MNMKPIMENWRRHIKEGKSAGKGVQLEWAIVYWSLKTAGKEQELEDRIKKSPELLNYGNGPMREAAISAVNVAKAAGAPIADAYHSDEKNISGNPEPKTDLLFGDHRVSVKMEGGIQLSSAEGRTTASMFRTVMEELLSDSDFQEDLQQDILEGIIERIEGTPTKMIDPKNLSKAMLKKPKQAMAMLLDGQLLDENNWKVWEAKNKQSIINDMVSYLENNAEFKFRLIEEAMTGKRAFGAESLATADYIMTPSYYGPIDKNYIIKTMRATKIQVRAKSRSGITSAAFRFDVASASKIAATAIDDEPESLNEGFKEKLKSLALKWLKGFKDYLRRWFMKNIGNIIKKILPIFDVSFQ